MKFDSVDLKLNIYHTMLESSLSYNNYLILNESSSSTIIDIIKKIIKEFVKYCIKLRDDYSVKYMEDIAEETVSKAREFLSKNRRIALESSSVYNGQWALRECRSSLMELRKSYETMIRKEEYDGDVLGDIYETLCDEIDPSSDLNKTKMKFNILVTNTEIQGKSLKKEIEYWKDMIESQLKLLDDDDNTDKSRLLSRYVHLSISIAKKCIQLTTHTLKDSIGTMNKMMHEYKDSYDD